jgi:3'-phosphoadenosine 5'-phosphosulfate sulfotransferase (PAPS reductase)/FAD synthetase
MVTKDIVHLVSVSGGKDSTATLLLALKQFPASTHAVFADTGNEHEATYEYLDYLEQALGLKIQRLKQDFTDWWWRRRDYVRDKWPEKGVTDDCVLRALTILEQGPTGNPFLDLCMLKGRFPSRMTQFCTQYLKTEPLTEFALGIVDLLGDDVWSWQGVRRDESARRANASGFENIGGGLFAFRPIVGWTAQQTVDFVRSCGVKLNPLYALGMSRVGCLPCINANKDELAEIARRFPEHIARIAEWESLVAQASKRQESSFFPAPTKDNRGELRGNNIYSNVQWAKTFRGGRVANPEWDEPAPACASSYGLCE